MEKRFPTRLKIFSKPTPVIEHLSKNRIERVQSNTGSLTRKVSNSHQTHISTSNLDFRNSSNNHKNYQNSALNYSKDKRGHTGHKERDNATGRTGEYTKDATSNRRATSKQPADSKNAGKEAAGKDKDDKAKAAAAVDPNKKPSLDIQPGYMIRQRWECLKKLGSGGFGEVHMAYDKHTKKKVAVKMEALTQSKQVLKMEVAVLKKLQDQSKHVCKLVDCGRNQNFNYMVMTLLGHSLADLRRAQTNNAFSLSTALRLTNHMLLAVRDMHNTGYLHRDIKPSNFAVGASNRRKIYMFDFGLARIYMMNGRVREARAVAGFRGTVRYASLTAHRSKEMGRVDDLWSLFYIMLEFVGLQLPWKKIKVREEVGKLKEETDHYDLLDQCREKDYKFPVKYLAPFLAHLYKLDYAAAPDYEFLSNLLQKALTEIGASMDDPYDWEIKAKERGKTNVRFDGDSSGYHIRFGLPNLSLEKNLETKIHPLERQLKT